jgi:hypothetical protein
MGRFLNLLNFFLGVSSQPLVTFKHNFHFGLATVATAGFLCFGHAQGYTLCPDVL